MSGFFGGFFGDIGGGGGGGLGPTPPPVPVPAPSPVVYGTPLYMNHVLLAIGRLCEYSKVKA